MPSEPFRAFLNTHTARIEPLSREVHIAYWDATITGDKADYDRFTRLDLEHQLIYADRDEFEKLRAWRNDGAVTNPVEKRALDVLYRGYLRHQVDHSLLDRITTLSGEIVNRFNVYRVEIDGRTLTSNEVRTILRESTDSEFRRAVWDVDKRVAREVEKPLLELVRLRNEKARALGFSNYYAMSLELSEQNQDDLFALFDRLKDLTDEPFRVLKEQVDQSLARRYGITTEELFPWHYQDSFFQEAPRTDDVDFDRYYRDRDVVKLVADFFEGIGLQVTDIIAESDLYEKSGKEQHAYCMNIDRKGDIRVLANVQADENWTGTMLHELGHAVYDRYIDAGLPFVLREHAHVFTTEAIAMLFGRLSKNPAWIQSMIGIENAERDAIALSATRQQRLAQLVFARWCQVMVRFERLLYEDPEQDLNAAWWDLVQRYQFVTPPEGRDEPDWAAKIHVVSAPVYYHNYMLGELLASQLEHDIQKRIPRQQETGNAMTGERAVGDYLRENVFVHGRRYTWDEMIRRATGEPLNPEHFVSQFVR